MTIAPEGRKLLRLEVRNAETPIERKPSWIRTKARTGPQYTELKGLVRSGGLHTVCEEAGCPNTGRPAALDRDEPRRVAESAAQLSGQLVEYGRRRDRDGLLECRVGEPLEQRPHLIRAQAEMSRQLVGNRPHQIRP